MLLELRIKSEVTHAHLSLENREGRIRLWYQHSAYENIGPSTVLESLR